MHILHVKLFIIQFDFIFDYLQTIFMQVASADDSETQADAGEVEPQSDTKDIVYNPILPAVSVQTLEEEEEVIAFG